LWCPLKHQQTKGKKAKRRQEKKKQSEKNGAGLGGPSNGKRGSKVCAQEFGTKVKEGNQTEGRVLEESQSKKSKKRKGEWFERVRSVKRKKTFA